MRYSELPLAGDGTLDLRGLEHAVRHSQRAPLCCRPHAAVASQGEHSRRTISSGACGWTRGWQGLHDAKGEGTVSHLYMGGVACGGLSIGTANLQLAAV